LTHKFDDNTSGKVKVNHNGVVDGVLKHKLSEKVTAAFVTSLDVHDVSNQKAKPFPVGISFDLKL